MLVKRVGLVLSAAIMMGLLAACAPDKELTDRVVPPTPTVAISMPTGEPEDSAGSAQVVVAGVGLSFAVPAGWQETTPGAMMWSQPGAEDAVLGFTWAEVAPPAEVEAVLLPADAVVRGAEPLDLPWVDSAQRYLVEVYRPDDQMGEIDHYEMHVIAVQSTGGVRRAFDFYLSAHDRVMLEDLRPALDDMINSSAFSG